jgi:hypothetical protein
MAKPPNRLSSCANNDEGKQNGDSSLETALAICRVKLQSNPLVNYVKVLRALKVLELKLGFLGHLCK